MTCQLVAMAAGRHCTSGSVEHCQLNFLLQMSLKGGVEGRGGEKDEGTGGRM